MKLTDTQLVILSAASQRQDRAIELALTLKGGAAHKVLGKLLTEGLIEEIQASGSLPVWRRDEDKGPFSLRITKRGLAAKPQALEVRLATSETSAQGEVATIDDQMPRQFPTKTIMLAWTAPSFAAVKGIVHAPTAKPPMKAESRTALLTAIVKARGWIDDIRLGRIASFAETARREAQGERHIRLLAPLAFVSPRFIAAILDGTAPADLTVTGLAKCLPYSWAEQEQSIGLLQ
jgi:hypothetical protein